MANEQNLVSLADRTTKEKREIGIKGGIASGEARRRKASMKETLEMLLDEKSKKTGKTYREMATLGLINGAIKGNGNNYRTMLEVLGELQQMEEDRQMRELSKVEELLLKIEKEAKNDIK